MSVDKRFVVKLQAQATQANVHAIHSRIRKANFKFGVALVKETIGRNPPTITLLFRTESNRLDFCEEFNLVNEIYDTLMED